MSKSAIITLDSATLNYYLTNPISNLVPRFESSRSILLGIYDLFDDLSCLKFTTPESIKSDKQLFELKNGLFVPVDSSFESDLLLILGVDTEEETYSFSDLELQYSIYHSLSSKIGRFSNPLDSKFNISKDNLYSVFDNSILPKRYSFSSWEDLLNLVSSEGNLVLKNAGGAGGDQVFLLNVDTFDSISERLVDEDLSNYLVQESIDSVLEKRLVYFGDDLVGSRIIYDRFHPWEVRGEVDLPSRSKRTVSYFPSSEEIKKGLNYSKSCNLDYSTVDFLVDSSGKEYLLELNGIHPGMIGSDHKIPIYDLGNRFAKFIKEDLLKK